MRRGEGEPPRFEKKQISGERLAHVVLDYLVLRRENHSPGCTAYDIARNAPKLTTTQRQQRIEAILSLLEKQGLVHAERYEKASYYSITDYGMDWYKTIAKAFWAVLEPIYERATG